MPCLPKTCTEYVLSWDRPGFGWVGRGKRFCVIADDGLHVASVDETAIMGIMGRGWRFGDAIALERLKLFL